MTLVDPRSPRVERALRAALAANAQRLRMTGHAAATQVFAQALGSDRYRAWHRESGWASRVPARLPRDHYAILLWPLAPEALDAAIEERRIVDLVAGPHVEAMPLGTPADLAVGYAITRWLEEAGPEAGAFRLAPPVVELTDSMGRRRVLRLAIEADLWAPAARRFTRAPAPAAAYAA